MTITKMDFADCFEKWEYREVLCDIPKELICNKATLP